MHKLGRAVNKVDTRAVKKQFIVVPIIFDIYLKICTRRVYTTPKPSRHGKICIVIPQCNFAFYGIPVFPVFMRGIDRTQSKYHNNKNNRYYQLFYDFFHMYLTYLFLFTIAIHSTSTLAAPAFINTLLHSFAVVPVVKISSTSSIFLPFIFSGSVTSKAFFRFFSL